MPHRIQQRRVKGFKLPPFCRSVARPSIYGNPFRVGDPHPETGIPIERGEAVSLFERWLHQPAQHALIERARRELRGMDLACFCKLSDMCHADVWLKILSE